VAAVPEGREGNGGGASRCGYGGELLPANIQYMLRQADYFQANALSPKWGQTIFQSANEIAANTQLRKRLDEIQAQAATEKEWWEKKRATIQSEFMKELDGAPTTPAKSSTGKAGSDEDAILVEGGGPAVGSMKKKGKK
jgi:translocation protein SEC66